MKIKLKNSKRELIVGNLRKENLEKLILVPSELNGLQASMNSCFANNKELSIQLNDNIQSLLNKVNSMELDKAANITPKQLLSNLAVISNDLHNLNCNAYNYYLNKGEEVPNKLIKSIESVIDTVDMLYIDGFVVPMCKKAIIEGFMEDEFENKFSELCKECSIVNPEVLMQCALDIFYEESIYYNAM